jgi:hypothetical protein
MKILTVRGDGGLGVLDDMVAVSNIMGNGATRSGWATWKEAGRWSARAEVPSARAYTTAT